MGGQNLKPVVHDERVVDQDKTFSDNDGAVSLNPIITIKCQRPYRLLSK